ncbi:MAG TPA: excinuclease ABC subunit UvrA, partial [Pirellulaceae bacterium]|nr:excinuclease ABC subunit UvrA [Pirellulaceae bacterium]
MSTSPQLDDPTPSHVHEEALIRIRGARVHNLRNVSLDIPRNELVVLTGPSGSGKSSLAFDTIFAEGQRQFIESLSVYARQFLHQMERPDVDLIEGLQPTLCIDQRPGNQNPRSTVATVTEIYDYLRLMMARLGTPHCPDCDEPIQQQTTEQIKERLLELPAGTKAMLLAPLVRGRRGQHQEVFAQIRKAGLVRARVDGDVYEVDQAPELEARKTHHIDAVVDRIIIRPGIDSRLAESIQMAIRLGDGLMAVCYHTESDAGRGESANNGWKDELYSTVYACPKCNISFEEVEPRTFSFNSPYGACPECDGLGTRDEFDPELILPSFDVSLADGAIVPWKGVPAAATKKLRAELDKFFDANKATWEMPLAEYSEAALNHLLHGQARPRFLGALLMLEKEYVTATRQPRLEQLATFRGKVTCRECGGSRLRREAAGVRVGGKTIHEITQLSVRRAKDFFDSIRFPARDRPVAEPLLTEIRHRLEFLIKVGVDYLGLGRAADTLSGGELQRVRLATSIGSGLVGVCYVLDEPSIGLHQRDNQRLIDAIRDLQRQGNTVIVVEHDEAMMREADRLIDVGPGAGSGGGRVIAQGTTAEVCANQESVTGRYLAGVDRIAVPEKRRRAAKSRSLVLEGAEINNLQRVDASFPLGCFVCVTGVSGSGKSSLINETLSRALTRRLGGAAPKPGRFTSLRGVSQIDKVIQIDQSPIGRTPR